MNERVSSSLGKVYETVAPFLRFFGESEWVERGHDADAADFVAGNPQEMPIPEFAQALHKAVDPQTKEWFAYTMSNPDAVRVVAASLRESTGIPFEEADISMTNGNFGGLLVSMRASCDPGDEVIFLSPPWFFYEGQITSLGFTPVRVKMEAPRFDIPFDAIEAAITPKTRAIIVNTPHNPSGRVFPPADLERLAGILTAGSVKNGRPIMLLSDEAYCRILYDGNVHTTPSKFYPDTFVIYTYGKQLLTPGQRMGFIALPPTMENRQDVRDSLMLAQVVSGWVFPNAVMQYALKDLEPLSIDLANLQKKRDRLVEGLRGIGYEVESPEGTFYLLPKVPGDNEEAFIDRLARDKVFVLPGSIVELPGYVRLSDTASDEMIDRAMPVFEAAFKELTG
jgi:aspartate aminotransferase